jgi:cbb3-type cytochrome oxidase maturation protein
MEILMMLIPLSALIVIGAAVMFFRAADSGQFDDLERNGRAALFEDPRADAADVADTLRKQK